MIGVRCRMGDEIDLNCCTVGMYASGEEGSGMREERKLYCFDDEGGNRGDGGGCAFKEGENAAGEFFFAVGRKLDLFFLFVLPGVRRSECTLGCTWGSGESACSTGRGLRTSTTAGLSEESGDVMLRAVRSLLESGAEESFFSWLYF